jgi:hypothetical protein
LHIVIADSFGTAEREPAGIATPYKLRSARHDIEKAEYVNQFDLRHVASFGSGNNDRLMLQAVREGGGLSIAVDNGEGCAMYAMRNADLFAVGAAKCHRFAARSVALEGHPALLTRAGTAAAPHLDWRFPFARGTTLPSRAPH